MVCWNQPTFIVVVLIGTITLCPRLVTSDKQHQTCSSIPLAPNETIKHGFPRSFGNRAVDMVSNSTEFPLTTDVIRPRWVKVSWEKNMIMVLQGERNWQGTVWYNCSKYGEYWGEVAETIPQFFRQLQRFPPNRVLRLGMTQVEKDALEFKPLFDYIRDGTVLVHFRCSDVPFIRHAIYHLQPPEYWKFVAEKIIEQGGRRVIFTMCEGSHNNPNELAARKCPSFVSAVVGWLREFLPNSVQVCERPLCWGATLTYNLMGEAFMLVSAMESSFSFIAGIPKGKRYVSPNLNPGKKGDKKSRRCNALDIYEATPELADAVHWNMFDGSPIDHAKVLNYSTLDLSSVKDFSAKLLQPY
eukprot:m.262380 g.262380  ORF g.262380 m.262380 type:complete len:356 (+) comp45404_c0_seq1:281-1348(+)